MAERKDFREAMQTYAGCNACSPTGLPGTPAKRARRRDRRRALLARLKLNRKTAAIKRVLPRLGRGEIQPSEVQDLGAVLAISAD